jgi:hypothetical protein
MSAAFEDVCHELGLSMRQGPLSDMIANAIVDCVKNGIRDPVSLRKCAHDALASR